MITLIAVAALLAQTPASPARAKEPWPVIVRWETRGFCPALLPGTSDANPAHLPQTEKPSTLIELIVKSSGLTGNATAGAAGAATWEMRSGSLTAVLAGGPAERGAGPFVDRPYGRFDAHPDLPEGWIFRDAKAGGTQGVVLTIDLNAARTSTEQLFDAPWVQRLLDRLALDNARLVSLRATLNPPTADGLPRLLELKALVSARSNQPGKNVTQITLVAPGWGGTNAEAEAVKG
ncbi:MAG: hypothetical protein K2Q09_02090, partial [Phycisphaerales bacterium]|nr:hypothetical protein [Phycisphaerales bacterium]